MNANLPDAARTVVITGAGSGVGRATARAFAVRGDRVALLGRGERGLAGAAEDVRAAGGTPLAVPVDVSDPRAVDEAAERIETELGPIDVWVNNAAVGLFAPFTEIRADEFRRVTEVTYLGCVNGTRAALRRMVPRDHGTVVQVGSALAYRGVPLQSAYSGAVHAVQGWNESLRCELLHAGSRVRTTMVQLPAVNTPQFDWALSRLPGRARPLGPVYQPEVAARAVVHAADHPGRREYRVGAATAAALVVNALAPGLFDRYLARTGFRRQQEPAEIAPGGDAAAPHADEPAPSNLWAPVDGALGRDFGAHGRFDGESRDLYADTVLLRHPAVLAAAVAGAAAAVAAVTRAGRRTPTATGTGGAGAGARAGARGGAVSRGGPRRVWPAGTRAPGRFVRSIRSARLTRI
ncbi:SDR family oxidoreductase [Streptomyces sp. NRRL S-118]|uniref:SDR family oxidoreductase n=1 Tax=Streptomyces sp. NRRL S-118 TaxID=1463881 RepID=UPI0007C719C3|nr:SDR family oxidoreductase [Streptomyces sp. NRRL S-118]